MNLPIDVVPGTNPPRFLWKQVVDTPNGKQMVEHEGTLSPTIERAVERLVTIAKQLLFDNAALRDKLDGFAERIAAQSELLGKKAEKTEPLMVSIVENVGTVKKAEVTPVTLPAQQAPIKGTKGKG